MEAIKTVGLTKKYKNLTAVDGLDLSVERGELFSLLGVNGAGKTTTIKMLSCLTKPTGGDAFLLGRSIARDAAEVKNIIGVSPQETAVAPGLTVKENLTLMCGVHGFSREKRQRKLEELTERFDLTEVLGRKAGKLSGGWQRRLSIAMALISEPEILFLDEPTLGLDVLARSDLWDIIRSMKGRMLNSMASLSRLLVSIKPFTPKTRKWLSVMLVCPLKYLDSAPTHMEWIPRHTSCRVSSV